MDIYFIPKLYLNSLQRRSFNILILKSRTVHFTQYLLSILYWTLIEKYKQGTVPALKEDYKTENVLDWIEINF